VLAHCARSAAAHAHAHAAVAVHAAGHVGPRTVRSAERVERCACTRIYALAKIVRWK
jgi:hypothetical protein